MITTCGSPPNIARRSLLSILVVACHGMHVLAGDRDSEEKPADPANKKKPQMKQESANDYLTIGDIDKFRPGRLKDEILKDVQWRASSAMAAECKGQRIFALDYSLVSNGPDRYYGDVVVAIFEDNKFVKFVKWRTGKTKENGELTRCDWLLRALKAEALSREDLQEDITSITPPPPRACGPRIDSCLACLATTAASPCEFG
jgi:hypothetical protein